MAAVALVYNPQSDHDDRPRPPHQVRFLSGYYELDEIGRVLRREAEAVGIMDADVQLAFSDGGSGLERTLTTFFPRTICILDFWHAKEHLVELLDRPLFCSKLRGQPVHFLGERPGCRNRPFPCAPGHRPARGRPRHSPPT